MNELSESKTDSSDRWTLIRDIAVLQAKLVVDGLRDLILVPASLIAGIVSLVSSVDGRPGDQFYQLLGMGKEVSTGSIYSAPCGTLHLICNISTSFPTLT